MIEYRAFKNSDPPQLVELWHACELGRGAATAFSTDAFERANFSQPYFDRAGLIVAVDGSRIIGFAHAGFGCNEDQSALDRRVGVICAIMVRPDYRRRGIGRELFRRAECYLRESGAQTLQAGASGLCDPFYFGLYGGSRPSGFLESDANSGPFLAAMCYKPAETIDVLQRDISEPRDPINFRLTTIRRKWEVELVERTHQTSWWWETRFGRMESLGALLVRKGDAVGDPVAGVTITGLDCYRERWHHQALGLSQLFVIDSERGKGFGQAILVETIRRLRKELVTLIEIHVPSTNPSALATARSAGFVQVDTGIVYRVPPDSAPE